MPANKEDIRRAREGKREKGFPLSPGVLAEKIRQQPFYRAATALYVEPVSLFRQVRINCLSDGKALLSPTPSLKKGFFLLRPYSIPFIRLSEAVTPRGMEKYGEILSNGEQASGVRIDLFVVGCLAADRRGFMIGDGNGFFDLSMAILSIWETVAAGHLIVAVLPEEGIVEDPIDASPWDCFANLLLTEHQVLTTEAPENRNNFPLLWDRLPEGRIRKITPLWKLRQAMKGQ
ncbi:MAG: 5-formyltetrahydrofolate cyclo-ligase [Deltaproteobacteria bacterium]